jgi:hypothetical protein
MKLRVYVTKQDIKEGKRKSNCDCPVARAIRRALANCGIRRKKITVGIYRIQVAGQMDWTSARVGEFITSFDAGRTNVSPFSFTLNLPRMKIAA